MTHVTVSRFRHLAHSGTLGIISVGEVPVCLSKELPWRNNERRVSCIPAGEYLADWFESATFGTTYKLKDVLGRSDILFHAGNFLKDTDGCILPGMSFVRDKGEAIITMSKSAVTSLMARIGNKKQIMVTVEWIGDAGKGIV